MLWRAAFVIGLSLVVGIAAGYAQMPSSAPKDRKDYLLEAVESQRNDALAKLAICYADANGQIADLTAKLSAANAALAAAKAPTPTPPAPQ